MKRGKTIILENYHLLIWFLLGGGAAIGLAMLNNAGELSKITIMSDYFIHQYDYKSIEFTELLVSVLVVRIPFILGVLLGVRTAYRNQINNLICMCFGFSFFYVLYILLARYGVGGIAIHMLLLSPHGFLYLFSIYKLMRAEDYRRNQKLGLTLLFLLGILLETYINPLFVSSMLRFF